MDAVVSRRRTSTRPGSCWRPERRTALIAWLRESGAIAVEDDYDAEYRYDRPAVGALQGLDQDHVVYAGTVSKVLAPALRLGWLVLPPSLVDAVREEKLLHDQGTARIEQLAFAHFLARGELDRHLRRMRTRYRAPPGRDDRRPGRGAARRDRPGHRRRAAPHRRTAGRRRRGGHRGRGPVPGHRIDHDE